MTTVLVVDDAQFVRTVVGDALRERGYDVRTASDGQAAIESVRADPPDVITMDVAMPGVDGIEATDEILRIEPTPIVMLSAHTETGADATLRALARGALAFVPKTGTEGAVDITALVDDLTRTIDGVADADVDALAPPPGGSATDNPGGSGDDSDAGKSDPDDGEIDPGDAPDHGPDGEVDGTPIEDVQEAVAETLPESVEYDADRARIDPATVSVPDVAPGAIPDGATVVIGASTGGPAIVEAVLAGIAPETGARVLVVQHMPRGFTTRLARRLDDVTGFEVSEASESGTVGPGEAVVAAGDAHLVATDDVDGELHVTQSDDPPVNSVRPAVDVTMESVADLAPPGLVGVVLTGMGRDGAAGAEAIAAAGGTVIAQDEASSPVFGMPRAAIETGAVDRVVPAAAVPEAVVDALTRREEAQV